MAAQARYPLADVFSIISSGDSERVWFSAPSRSIDKVIKVYMKTNTPKTIQEAQNFIMSGIKSLTPNDFVQSQLQWDDPKCVADVYGLIYDNKPWYVKFLIEQGDLEQISFHPPEKEMKTVTGKIISQGDPI